MPGGGRLLEPGRGLVAAEDVGQDAFVKAYENLNALRDRKAFGPWLLHALKLLARCKGLRGTLLDPFGYTRERRAERRLIGEYEHTLQGLRESLSPGNHALAVQIAALPQQIRGFGDVKRASYERVKHQEKALLDRFLKREHTRGDEPDGEAFGGASGLEHL